AIHEQKCLWDAAFEVGGGRSTGRFQLGQQGLSFRSEPRAESASLLEAKRLVERGEHLLRRECSHRALSGTRRGAGGTGTLVGLAQTDALNEPAEVESTGGELGGQFVEDFFPLLGGDRVQVVDCRDQSGPTQILPDAIDDVGSKVAVLRSG